MDKERTNKEEKLSERVGDSNERGHPHGFKDTKHLKQIIKQTEEQIEYEKKLIDIDEKKFKLMIKYPKPTRTNFEYEEQEEWVELARMYHELKRGPTMDEHDMQIKSFKDRIRNVQDMIETAKVEKEETEELKRKMKEYQEKKDGNGK